VNGSYNPRNEPGYFCRHHEAEPAGEMWPWKKSDRLCMPCIYDSQADAETLSDRDRARGYPAPRLLEIERAPDGRVIGSEYPKDKDEPQ
jgi:hypothetical protein